MVNVRIVLILRIVGIRAAVNLKEGLGNVLPDVATLADVICKRHDRERNKLFRQRHLRKKLSALRFEFDSRKARPC